MSMKDIDALDIDIPILTRCVYREYKNLADLDIMQLDFAPVTYQKFGKAEIREIVFEYMTTSEVAHTTVLESPGTRGLSQHARLFRPYHYERTPARQRL